MSKPQQLPALNIARKTALFLLALLIAVASFGQQGKKTEKDFEADFSKALDKKFTEDQLNKLFAAYDDLLTPQSDETRLPVSPTGQPVIAYPLAGFKRKKLYADHINGLLDSKNPFQRILAYLVIGASFDTTKESVLLNKIKTEQRRGNLIWAAMALFYLQTTHTTALFDFLVKNEDFGDAHMLPMFIQLDKDSLLQTAWQRINYPDDKSKILAAQILAYTTLNDKTAEILKKATQTWDLNIKGYAIFSLKELQIGDLLGTLQPLLAQKETRAISLEALANSPTQADRDFLVDLAGREDTIPSELLDSWFKSKRIDNLRYWLKLLYTRPVPAKYVFFEFEQPLLKSDSILPDVQEALQMISNKKILGELARTLGSRTDDRSIDIMISLLKNKSPGVRYWTAFALQTNPADKLKTPEVKALLAKGLEDGNTPDD